MLLIPQTVIGQEIEVNKKKYSTLNFEPITLSKLKAIDINFDPQELQVNAFLVKAVSCKYSRKDEISIKVRSNGVSVIQDEKFSLENNEWKSFKLRKKKGCINEFIIEIGYVNSNRVDVIRIYKEK